MSNRVKKFILDDRWSIGKNESWFSDMAAKGLHLKSIKRMFVVFEKGEPSKTKYRIDILNEKPMQEQLDLYKDYDWDFVTSSGSFYIFSSLESSHSPELHTDPVEQSYSLMDFDKHLKKNLILMSVVMLLFLGMMFSILFLESKPFLSMVKGQLVQQILFLVVEVYVFYSIIGNFRAVHTLRKSLAEGKPINHKENWRKSRLINGTVSIIFVTMAVFSACYPIIEMIKSKEYTLPETTTGLPIVRLMEIEENPNLQREVVYNPKVVDRENRIEYHWSLLAPVQYEIDENSIIKDERWEDNSGEYAPSIYTQFYQLTFPKMAEGLIRDLMKSQLYKPDIITQKIENTLFDQIYVVVDGTKKQIFACRGNKVIYIRYYGNKDINHIIPIISKKLASLHKIKALSFPLYSPGSV